MESREEINWGAFGAIEEVVLIGTLVIGFIGFIISECECVDRARVEEGEGGGIDETKLFW